MSLTINQRLLNAAKNYRRLATTGVPIPDDWQNGDDLPDLGAELDAAIADAERRPVEENQFTISEWAEKTFGPVGSNARVCARANEEMAELLRALTSDDDDLEASEEIADIVIVLYRLADRLGVDLHECVDHKMLINRTRVWKRDDTGHGYHLRDKEGGA